MNGQGGAPSSTVAAGQDESPAEGSQVEPQAADEDAIDSVLAQSYRTTEFGNGEFPECPDASDDMPRVSFEGQTDGLSLVVGSTEALCLQGFDPDESIRVITRPYGGDAQFETVFEPRSGVAAPLYPTKAGFCDVAADYLCAAPTESRNLLFSQATRPIFVHERLTDTLISNGWRFSPSIADELVGEGGFEMRAEQGDLTAWAYVGVFPLVRDFGYTSWLQSTSDSPTSILLTGWSRGQRIPIGLYGAEEAPGPGCPAELRLQETIAVVEIPISGQRIFEIPARVIEQGSSGVLVISAPVDGGDSSSPRLVNGEPAGTCALSGG